MYIKMMEVKGSKPVVVNYNIANCNNFYVEDSTLVFSEELAYKRITFASTEDANNAFERVFERLGYKAPMNNWLDLTSTPEEEEIPSQEQAEAEKEKTETKESKEVVKDKKDSNKES